MSDLEHSSVVFPCVLKYVEIIREISSCQIYGRFMQIRREQSTGAKYLVMDLVSLIETLLFHHAMLCNTAFRHHE